MDTHMFIWNASWGSRQPEHLHVTNGVNKPQNKASFFFSCTIYITKRLTKKLTVQLRMWGDSSHAAMSIHFHLIWFPQMALQMHTVLLTTFKFATISNTTAAASNTIPSPSSLCSFINQSSAAATSEEQQQQQQLKIATAAASQEQQQHHRSAAAASQHPWPNLDQFLSRQHPRLYGKYSNGYYTPKWQPTIHGNYSWMQIRDKSASIIKKSSTYRNKYNYGKSIAPFLYIVTSCTSCNMCAHALFLYTNKKRINSPPSSAALFSSSAIFFSANTIPNPHQDM